MTTISAEASGYSITLDTETSRVSISRDSGEWAGDGRWQDGRIIDCAAQLGDTPHDSEAIYTDLEDALGDAIDEQPTDRIAAARAAADARRSETGPEIELTVQSGGRRAAVNVRVRIDQLSAGAREAVEAGLRSTLGADDASRLIVRTGRTKGEARRAENAELERRGQEWLHAYGSQEGLDDRAPETERVVHHSSWCAERETPEEYLSRALGCYAGRVVAAGLPR